jgi:DNA polymerase
MSRWSDLFRAARGMTGDDIARHIDEWLQENNSAALVTDRDTSRHTGGATGNGEDFSQIWSVDVSKPVLTDGATHGGTGNGLSRVSTSVKNGVDTRESSKPAEMLGKTDGIIDVSPSVTVCQRGVHLDFETRNTNDIDLPAVGAFRYAEDPGTEILTLVYRDLDGTTQLWLPELGRCERLAALATDPTVTFVSFGDFEAVLWAKIMVPRFGFPPILVSRWLNTQAVCGYLALPRKLEKVLPVIGSSIVKDQAGNRFTLNLSKRNKKGEHPKITREIQERVHAYNRVDVDGLTAVHNVTGILPERERQVWGLDQAVNGRGLWIDTPFCRGGKQIAESLKDALFAEFAGLTGGLKPTEVEKTREHLKGAGFTLENLQADTIEDALDDLKLDDDDEGRRVRRVLQIRLITAPTSLAKLDTMLACTDADGRARGLFQYHGATPGRWSAQLLQPQNLPRPVVDIATDEIEAMVEAVKTGDPAALLRWTDPEKGIGPIDVLTSALRFALAAVEGTQFGVGDFSMIETCVLLALAGEHDKCRLIAEGADIYRDMAATIFGLNRETFLAIPEDKLTVEEQEWRRIGKNTILGCGFAMGADTFRRRYCRHMETEEAKEFTKKTVYTDYRKIWAPRVPRLWYSLEKAARAAMLQPGLTVTAECGIAYRFEPDAKPLPRLVCRLLNGKLIHYQKARVSPDDLDRWGYPIWTHWAYRRGQWREIQPYGGQLTENVVQALARELLVDAMFRLEERGFPVVMHCHDEIVVEHPEITAELMKEIMSERPRWAVELGVPVMVKAWVGRRYRK